MNIFINGGGGPGVPGLCEVRVGEPFRGIWAPRGELGT